MGNAAEVFDHDHDLTDEEHPAAEPLGLAPEPVEVRRNSGVAALVGALASAVAIAYLARASSTGAALDWVIAAAMGLLGIGHLVALVDARTPLLVADTQGVRIRLGRTWRGLPWGALREVQHLPRRGLFRDGRLVLVVYNPERLIEELDRAGRRQSRIARKMYGAPFAVPLALSTRVSGAGDDLTGALARLAADPSVVVELDPVLAGPDEDVLAEPETEEPEQAEEPDETGTELPPVAEEHGPRWHDPRPVLARGIGAIAARLQHTGRDLDGELPGEPTETFGPLPLVASATPSPLRDPVTAQRSEVRRDLVAGATALANDETQAATDLPEGRELRRAGSVNLIEETQVWGDRVRPIATAGNAVEPLLIDEFGVEPADDPVIGPELLAARTRLGLTVDQLAERTRIRPHVIESIEVDDFAPCGGDFYARGHLRTLARVLGVDVGPLLTSYDQRYADAPINPRRVFEAELATGANGSIRGTRGGPNWSVLIAAVMALVLAWSIARLIMDSPVELHGNAPILNGSAGVGQHAPKAAPAVPVVLNAAGGGAHVVVRDGSGTVVFNGNLAFGATKTLKVSPPVRVQSSDGSLETTVDGQERGALGKTGQPAQDTLTVG
jgi:hypothetical protein